MIGRRLSRVFLTLLVALVFACPIVLSRAEAAVDPTATGTLSLALKSGSDEDGTINDGVIAVYLVAGADYTPPAHLDTSVGKFGDASGTAKIETAITGLESTSTNDAAYERKQAELAMMREVPAILAAIPGLGSGDLDEHNQAYAQALEAAAAIAGISPGEGMYKKIANGQVSFSGLTQGLYLVCQVKMSTGNLTISPFLISIPDREGNLDVEAKPKPGVPSITAEHKDETIWTIYPPDWLNSSGDEEPVVDPDKPSKPDRPDWPDNPGRPDGENGPGEGGRVWPWYQDLRTFFPFLPSVVPHGYEDELNRTTDGTRNETSTNTGTTNTTGTTGTTETGTTATTGTTGSTATPQTGAAGSVVQSGYPESTRVEVPATSTQTPAANTVTQRIPTTADVSAPVSPVLLVACSCLGIAFVARFVRRSGN